MTLEAENTSVVNRITFLIDQFKWKKAKRKYVEKKLASCAMRSGFINDANRKQAWKILIKTSSCDYSQDQNEIESHPYYEQIKLDVIRTLKRFPPNYSDVERSQLQSELILIITKILIQHDELHYYQGYHDIALTFLLVLGDDDCLRVLDSITMSHLKYFMEPTMERTSESLSHLMPLVNCVNSECAEYIQKAGVGHVIFALPWFITWYSHVLDDLPIILRLYDLFIVSHFLMPIYVAAEIVNYHADEILSKPCDMAAQHHYLSSIPSEMDESAWEEVIKRALYLFNSHHPDTLDELNREWKIKCDFIEKSPDRLMARTCNGDNSSSNSLSVWRRRGTLWNVAFWGVSMAIGGLAVYFWSQKQLMSANGSMSLGDFLTHLYRT